MLSCLGMGVLVKNKVGDTYHENLSISDVDGEQASSM